MEFDQMGQLFRNRESDSCTKDDEGLKCDEKAYLGQLFQEINHVYSERLIKLDETGYSTELRMKLMYSWIADLLEQNASLVETVCELETVAAERVVLLEDKLRKSSSSVQEYMAKIQDPDELNAMSLHGLVRRLEVDIGSLLELIRRARTAGSWDMRGLTFHEVSYSDIFDSLPPPPSAPKKDDGVKSSKNDAELQRLKTEVEFWKMRAEKAETEEGKVVGDRELQRARMLAVERAEQIRALTHKLDEVEQHSKDMQAVLTAEVAEKHDQVVQLRQRLQQLEEDCRQANMQTHFRDQIIKGMRKEVKRFRSQLAVMDPTLCDMSDIMHASSRHLSGLDSGQGDACSDDDNAERCAGSDVTDSLSLDPGAWTT